MFRGVKYRRNIIFAAGFYLVFTLAVPLNAETGGVLFYAGFEDSLKAKSAGQAEPDSTGTGAPINQKDFSFVDGFRGKALLSFSESTSPRYLATDNFWDEQGSIEMWVSPVKWTPKDGCFHAFFQNQGPGWMWIYKYIDNTQVYFLLGDNRKEYKIANGSVDGWKELEWHQVVVTWDAQKMVLYLDGQAAARSAEPKSRRGGTSLFILGDGDLGVKRPEGVGSKIDEVYIYSRVLTAEEITWTFENAKNRGAGEDLPADKFPQAKKTTRPEPPEAAITVPVSGGQAEKPDFIIDYKYERGGVLFYAGFNGTRDAQAAGNGKAILGGNGGAITADGVDSIRGGALRTGDGLGHLEFSGEGNVRPDEGTIEMWIRPENWSSDDKQQHYYINIVGEGGGSIRFYKRQDTVNSFWVKAPTAPDPNHFDDKYAGILQTGYSCQQTKGKWCHYFFVWKKGEYIAKYRGGFPPKPDSFAQTVFIPGLVPSPGKPVAIQIGDFGGGEGRNAITLIDEVYIYNRALTMEECQWANLNAVRRVSGTDIPVNFSRPTAKVVPDPEKKTLVVEIDSGDRSGNFAGTARLEPASGTKTAPITPIEDRFGQALIPYTNLLEGKYEAIIDIATKDGKPIATVRAPLVVPGPPVWLTEKVGVSDTPPPPWTPVNLRGDNLKVWGREYTLGKFGLPSRIVTQDKSILAGPVVLQFTGNNKEVSWTEVPLTVPPPEERGLIKNSTVKQTDAQVTCSGITASGLGTLKWNARCEFDGFLLYDFELTPGVDEPELIELRVPIKKEYATLYYKGNNERGLLPEGTGTIYKSTGSGRYWWLGTDDFGLCGATEHDGANLDNAEDAFSIVREDNGNITIIYRFLSEPQKLTSPWRLRWILQATPTKPLPKDWRTWRDISRTPDGNHPTRLSVVNPWYNASMNVYMPFPVFRDPDWYRGYVKDLHSRNIKVLPYGLFICMPPEMPECAFYWREWFNPVGSPTVMQGWEKYAAVRLVPSYIDFMTWKHRELAKDYGHDGLYVDFAGVYGGPVTAPEYGLGYVKNGKAYPADFPVVAVREMWKRVYTMFKQLKPDSVIVGHVSSAVHSPVLSFCDVYLDGEHNWLGPLRDNYLEVLPLDALRAEFRSQHFGGIPWWLPQWYGAILEDKDVVSRSSGPYPAPGFPNEITAEKGMHLFGLGLLHDIGFFIACGQGGVKQHYEVLDKFGIGDAEFSGYWNNATLIAGQTGEIKASVYLKPGGGALVVIYNTTREKREVTLQIDWERLKSSGELSVVDAYQTTGIKIAGRSVTLEVPPLNHRLLRVK